KDLAREVEASVRSPSPAAPTKMIRGQHGVRAPSLGLEREEPIPGADVEHGPAAQILRYAENLQLAGRVFRSRRDDAVSQVNLLKPAQPGDLLANMLWILSKNPARQPCQAFHELHRRTVRHGPLPSRLTNTIVSI